MLSKTINVGDKEVAFRSSATVSYTHLDVYKRQCLYTCIRQKGKGDCQVKKTLR